MPPFAGLMATPAFSSPRLATFGCRPIANITFSEAMLEPLGQMRGEFVAVPVDFVDGAAGDDRDALLLHLGADMLADVLVETAQDVVAAVDHGHVRAEAGENAGEFQRATAAALDHDALRQFGEMKRLVGGDHVLDAGDFRPWLGAPPVAIRMYFAVTLSPVISRSV